MSDDINFVMAEITRKERISKLSSSDKELFAEMKRLFKKGVPIKKLNEMWKKESVLWKNKKSVVL